MAEKEKVTIMVLKVDLQCHKCYKKVKKVLCKFPQIRDEIYDEKQNQVVIKVVCCSPEKIRDNLCCKGGGAIKSIEIKEPEKPKPNKDDKEGKPVVANPKEADKQDKPAEPLKQNPPQQRAVDPPAKPTHPVLVPSYPPPVQVNTCCMDCYQGHRGGPCYRGYGGAAPFVQFDIYYGRPVYDSYGGGGSRGYNASYCVTRPDQCFSEENPQACTVM